MKLLDGDFTSIATNDHLIYAAEKRHGTISILEPHLNQKHTEHPAIKLTSPGGSFHTITIANHTLFLCDRGRNTLYTYSLDGACLRTRGHSGSATGEMRGARLCCGDGEGSVLLADRWNNRLQMRDNMGQWHVVDLEPPVHKPVSAVLVGETLYVVSAPGSIDKLIRYD